MLLGGRIFLVAWQVVWRTFYWRNKELSLSKRPCSVFRQAERGEAERSELNSSTKDMLKGQLLSQQ